MLIGRNCRYGYRASKAFGGRVINAFGAAFARRGVRMMNPVSARRVNAANANQRRCKKMKISYKAIIATALSTLILGVAGCAQKEGPAEQAGKSVDQAMDKVGQKIEQTGKDVQDAAKGDKK